LHTNNYIAYDLLSGKNTYAANYSLEEKSAFIARTEEMLRQIEGEKDVLTSIFWGIYANPVDNQFQITN
jgi:hypothetical protein